MDHVTAHGAGHLIPAHCVRLADSTARPSTLPSHGDDNHPVNAVNAGRYAQRRLLAALRPITVVVAIRWVALRHRWLRRKKTKRKMAR